ncbi:S8 family peptidase [Paraclostridium sordellii]|uniref:S8 family peptidase n=2 Tax=Paraclostridium sordellii TaxID=1505 RepID=UPI0005DEB5D3|nr:S8 family peptidase [Paeniclostridium sordellii]MDU6481220.1 S8 family serine peptidase [Paeniclostridium sordellii]CEN25192.1 subtilisin-like serine germination related protease [[Clostridium] sordellii] [Paeniclostridium sordellii]CEN27050.1 subtilisin-like serine germination related protease [[Clostridium] sordellii] [Paeniclostridium sordellii]CEN30133.1 subtilisin-like serine germination related protease [[Clostridium] sordellii] [Paeniclostridium sordellii]CEN30659.1 subtilisin-like s
MVIIIYCKAMFKYKNKVILIDENIEKLKETILSYYKIKSFDDSEIEDFKKQILLRGHNKWEYKDLKKYSFYDEYIINSKNNVVLKLELHKKEDQVDGFKLINFIKFIKDNSYKYKVPTLIDLNLENYKLNEFYKNELEKYSNQIYIEKNLKLDHNQNIINLNIENDESNSEINILKDKDLDVQLSLKTPNEYEVKNIIPSSKKQEYFLENTKVDINIIKVKHLEDSDIIKVKFQSKDIIESGKWSIKFNVLKGSKKNISIYTNKIKNYNFIENASISFLIRFGINSSIKSLKNRSFRDESINLSEFSPIFVIDYKDGFEEDIKELADIFKFDKLSDNFGILYINKSRTEDMGELYRITSIYRIQRYTKMVQLTNLNRGVENGYVATEEIGANFFKENPNITLDGRGVFIGIANSGIDYLHPDFIYPDGTSKIAYLWDQTKEGNPPSGFNIGTEYTREDINKAIKENNKTLSIDEEGIGTALSGICSGLGNVNKEYGGVAEGSDLIVIKLKKIDGHYNIATLHTAMRYAYKKAKEENKPIVNNVSLGSNGSVVTGTLIITDNLFYEYGVCEVIGAGNEGSGKTHASGYLSFKGDVEYVDIEIEEEEEEIEIDVLVNRPDLMNIAIVSPSGEQSKISYVSNLNYIQGLFDLENTFYSIVSNYPASYSGQQQTVIKLTSVKKGIWRIKLIGESITNGIYNIYLPNELLLKPGTKFRNGDPNTTLTYPSGYKDTITVGTYDSVNKSLWANSSRGPTVGATGRIEKPDVIAPGVNIIAPYNEGKYATVTGSGVSSAFVTGAMAVFFQYILSDKNYKNKAVVQKMRTYLRAGAKRVESINYPNTNSGYGLLDIKGMFDQLK